MVAADERQPVGAGDHAEGVSPQSLGGYAQRAGMAAFADEDPHRYLAGRRGDDAKPSAGDLFDIALQFARRELHRPRRPFGDDDLGPRSASFDDPRRGLHQTNRHQRKATDSRNTEEVRGHHRLISDLIMARARSVAERGCSDDSAIVI